MKTSTKILIAIFLLIISIKIFNIFIYPIPFEITAKGLDSFVDFLFPLSIAGLSALIIIKQIHNRHKIKYLFITLGIIGFAVSFFISLVTSFTSEMDYKDKYVKYQSLENMDDRIIQQFMDEGALGSNWREVRVKRTIMGIRYSDRFCSTKINGKWIYKDFKTQDIDTIMFDDFIYKSEINGGQNWTKKKCN